MARRTDIPECRRKFAATLSARRKERGYATAYRFYHDNGSRKGLGFTYHHYLLIEKGMRLPSLEGLRAVLDALGGGGISYHEERRELLTLFLRALTDGDSLFDPVFTAASLKEAPVSPEDELLWKAARQKVSDVPLFTRPQWKALMSSPATFWAYHWLEQTGQSAPLDVLTRALDLSAMELQAALGTLVDAKLVERRGQEYLCPHFSTDMFAPPGMMSKEEGIAISQRVFERLAAKDPSGYHGYYFLALENDERISRIITLLREAMRKGYLFRATEPVRGGKLIAVEARVSPVFKL